MAKFRRHYFNLATHEHKHKTKICKRRYATSNCFRTYSEAIDAQHPCPLSKKCANRCMKYYAKGIMRLAEKVRGY